MIEVENLCQTFGVKKAVDNLSFTVKKGQVLGLIGPNGAGKSTTMRMVAGFLRPTSGRASLNGTDVWSNPVKAKKQLGYLPESAPLFDDLTVDEFLRYLGGIRGLRGGELKTACDRVADLCFLKEVRHQLIDTLSKGYRHRTCLAQSILHDPPVVIFDEPTDGLDPNQKEEIRNLINGFRKNKAVILSTHILDEVRAVCTDVLLIDFGKKVFEGTPEQLKAQTPAYGNIRVRFKADVPEAVRISIEQTAGVNRVEWQADRPAELCIVPGDRTRPAAEQLAGKMTAVLKTGEADVVELKYDEGSLEQVFRAMTVQRENAAGRGR